MGEPLPWLIEGAVKIALDFLERSGDLGNVAEADRFLLSAVDRMIVGGEHRKLMLANRAIEAYRRDRCRLRVVR